MKSNKSVKAIEKLSPQELTWFQEFVESPYFNKHQNIRKLLDIIARTAPRFDKDALEKHQVFKKIFPNEKFNSQKLSDLLTYLFRLYEKFLAQLEFESDESEQKLALLKSYRARNDDKQFLKTARQIRHKGMVNGLDETRFLQAYRLESESDVYFTSKDSRTTDKSIERKTINLDLFFLTSKLRSCCEMINRQNIVSEHYDIRMLEEVQLFVRNNFQLLEEYPAVLIYYQILQTLQDSQNEHHYFRLVDLLENYSAQIGPNELRTMYDYAQNYCIKKINSGNSKYLNEIFKLYSLLLARDLMLDENRHLSQWDYKNIVTVGTRLNQYGWCEKFLHDYREKLPVADRENAFAFNLATLYYSQRKYDKALRLLQTVEFTDVYYGLGARSLLMKVYYESNEFEPLYSLFDSFKIYLKRNKLVSAYQYRVHFNLIKMTRRLAKIKSMKGLSRQETITKQLDKLKLKVDATPEITNLNWLLEMMDALRK